jgi:hypothetical protein
MNQSVFTILCFYFTFTNAEQKDGFSQAVRSADFQVESTHAIQTKMNLLFVLLGCLKLQNKSFDKF